MTRPHLVRRPLGIKPPTPTTLARYGLTADEWLAICRRQRWTCPICLQPFGNRLLVTDHDHVKGFRATKRRKAKRSKRGDGKVVRVRAMSQEERKQHVRGVVHAWCNGLIRVWLTLERAESITAYLRAHADRRAAASKR